MAILESSNSLADSSLSDGLVFWKDTERWANWGDHPHRLKGRHEECTNFRGISLLSLYAKWMPSALKKDAVKQLKWNWMICSSVFVLAIPLQIIFSFSSKLSKHHGSVPKTSTHSLLTSRKHTTRFLTKGFGAGPQPEGNRAIAPPSKLSKMCSVVWY